MNIYAKKGDKVKYIGLDQDQINYGLGRDPRELLVVGSDYFVEYTDVGNWSSTVKLQGFEGEFNTVGFEDA